MAELEIPSELFAELQTELDEQQAPESSTQDGYWLALARDAYENSTDYLDNNIRRQWSEALAHQNNQHAPGSKYYSDSYRLRSKIFRPKTRTNNQSAEAAFAKAMFSTSDLVSIEAQNDNDVAQQASAEMVNFLLDQRLNKDIKWYMTAMGAYQDARVYGVCASYQYWDFVEQYDEPEPEGYVAEAQPDEVLDEDGNPATQEWEAYGESGNRPTGDAYTAPITRDTLRDRLPPPKAVTPQVRVLRDRPAIDLLAPENIRFEPNADWRDPINTSPYVVRLVPLHCDEAMNRIEGNGWHAHTMAELIQASAGMNHDNDETRQARAGNDRSDPAEQANAERNEFTLVWLHENFIRVGGQDYVYWTCGTSLLLSDPTPIEDVYPHLAHGERPITMGVITIESHRAYPMAPTNLIAPLQVQSNEICNQRMDNVQLVLNKRYLVRRQKGGNGVDLAALSRSVPGGSVMVSNPESDVRVLETNDVTGSSYQEQDRLDLAIDELSGTFSQQTVQNNRNLNETVGGMEMMNAGASDISEYAIRTFIETWVEPTLSQLARLEQFYETDETLLALAGEQSEHYQRAGADLVLDEMLRQQLTIKVNAGFGKTDPQKRINSLNIALSTVANVLPDAVPRLKSDEIIKEVFGNAGYRDGARFFKPLEQFQQEQQNQQPPIDPVKQQELQLKAEQMQFEREKFQAELALKERFEMMRLALDEKKTVSQLQAQLGIKQMDNDTKRAIEAGKQTLDQARLINERNNQSMGYDTYG